MGPILMPLPTGILATYSNIDKCLDLQIRYLASDAGVNLAATLSPKTRGCIFDRVRFEKLMPEPYHSR